MNARLALIAAVLLGAAVKASASGARTQARTAVDTSRVYDGTRVLAEATPVYAGDPSRQPALTPEQIAAEEQRRAALRNNAALTTGLPTPSPAPPAKKPLIEYNPLLNAGKGAILGAIVGWTLGGPLGMLVAAAAFGGVAWGMTKVDQS